MCVQQVEGFVARCEARGSERTVSLLLLQHESIAAGDMVLVHLGTALRKVDAQEAQSVWRLFDEMLAAVDAATHAPSAVAQADGS